LPKSFKKLYRFEWKISAQKEAFVKCLLEAWGLRVKASGIGVMSIDYVSEYESLPDFSVYFNGKTIAFIEVTGGNIRILPNLNLWIAYHKYNKYNELYRKVPVYFIYIGFNNNLMSFIKYLPIWEIDRYAKKNIIIKTIRGRKERYITIPFSYWRDLKQLYYEFLQVLKKW